MLIGSGVGIGLTLNWLVEIDLGMSVLIGVVALAFTVQMVSWLLMLLPPEVEEGDEEAQEERPRDIVYVVEEIRSKRRGRKGSR